ncbi:hypothetical protein [Dongshaea marina]|uniref:hypothetical protein n=1 Tax=Dongshaea marina TaxID=2047966 RepID=UPI000D3E0B96|nr:hypothetical protein [Dongshaea marina]
MNQIEKNWQKEVVSVMGQIGDYFTKGDSDRALECIRVLDVLLSLPRHSSDGFSTESIQLLNKCDAWLATIRKSSGADKA